jgi:SAM-dependent methyltransferase
MSPHSEDWFGDERDHWWNQDFLALMARRWRLDRVKRVLDVGCGQGHWGRALLPHLPRASLTGIDPEPEWVTRAGELARGLPATYQIGTAERVPFPDGSFDLVTCQTVLIHLRDVPVALAELVRVLAPGGLLAVAEPNNLCSSLIGSSTRHADPLDRTLALARFHALCERGKATLGEGYDSIGDLLPGLFSAAGLEDVRVYLADRPSPLVPPYADEAQRAACVQLDGFVARDLWTWPEAQARRYFVGGGGAEAEFPTLWRLALDTQRRDAEAIHAGTLHTAGGGVTYLVSGRKPT